MGVVIGTRRAGLIMVLPWLLRCLAGGYGLSLLVGLLALPVISFAVRLALRRWRIARAFSRLPCEPDDHPVFGHALRVRFIRSLCACSWQ